LEHRQSVIVNGEFQYADKVPLPFDNRAFLYGDSVFETLIAVRMHLPFLDLHLARLSKALSMLGIESEPKFNLKSDILRDEILRLLNKNKHYLYARVRVQVFRSSGGLFSPENLTAQYLIQTTALNDYNTHKHDLFVSVYQTHKVTPTEFSPYKISGNFRINILAGIAKKSIKADDMLLLNNIGNVCDSISSNVFSVKNNIVATPPVASGCVSGITRGLVMKLANQAGLRCVEHELTLDNILQADEVFLSNSIRGICGIRAFNQQRYLHATARKLSDALVELQNSKVFL